VDSQPATFVLSTDVALHIYVGWVVPSSFDGHGPVHCSWSLRVPKSRLSSYVLWDGVKLGWAAREPCVCC